MTSSVWIKICGLTTEAGVEAAVRAQVDALGFVFAPSTRRVTPQRAVELTRGIATVQRIAVLQHPEQSLLDEVCDVFKPDVVQIDSEDLRNIKIPPHVQVTPVLRAGRDVPTPLPARVLFEGPVSGTGRTADWTSAAQIARRTKLILAGGLNAENVGEAIRFVMPFGVDVSSGVESAPGIKDPALIMRFVSAVRDAQEVAVM